MKDSNHTQKATRPKGDVYRAFMSLDRSRRRSLALRILRDENLLADLYDHFLVQRAMQERGRSISWATYRRTSKTSASCGPLQFVI